MSAVAVRANNRPTAVASGPFRAIRSVPGCRMSCESRACLAGLRIACARAVAGIVIRNAALCGACHECNHAAIIPVQGDQPTSIESDATHAALPFFPPLFCARGERTELAHTRSFRVKGPPVCSSASANISRHPAAS